LGNLLFGFFFLPGSDGDGKIRASKLAHPTLGALLGISQHRESVLIRGESAGRTKSHANAASFAPGFENVNLLFSVLLLGRKLTVGNWL
jgi:hypothetical protein